MRHRVRHSLSGFGAFVVWTGVFAAPSLASGDQLLNLSGVPKEERNFLPLEVTWPEKPGEAAICLWKDDKLGAFSYTIDDNNAMNIDWWLEEAKQRGIKLTWFLIAEPIGQTNPAANGNWPDWQKVREAGHALESHSMTHLRASDVSDDWKGIEWEYKDSLGVIDQGLGDGHHTTTLAYPGGKHKGTNDPAIAAKFFTAARTGIGMVNPPQGQDYLNVFATTNSNLGEQPDKPWGNADTIFDPESKSYRGWYVLVYHYVRENDPGMVARYRKELDYGVEHRDELWIARFNDIAQYAQSRETAKLTVTENTASRIVLKLEDRMDDRIFTFPLTIKVHLPQGWKTVKAVQNSQPIAARIVGHEGAMYALVDVVPDKGEAVLTP